MSKVAAYLRGHLSGEVFVRTDKCAAMASDSGILSIKPEIVIAPRNTNDVRKIARFSWQLAEKGHVLPVTPRGGGTDTTGAAIGSGIIMNLENHMHKMFEFDTKQKLVRLQPGASVAMATQALSMQGQYIPSLLGSSPHGTLGGAIANGTVGLMGGKYGGIVKSIDQLEIVLASGDVLQTGRISKKEFNKIKGEQGIIGDIYRGIDTLIEDNAELLDKLRSDDATGYNAVADVKHTDGSFDLTPLFVGSQGTLGAITEMILKTEVRPDTIAIGAYVYETTEAARDAFDDLSRMDPAIMEYFDAELYETALKNGKKYEFYSKASENIKPAAVVFVGFDDISERLRAKHLKKLRKVAETSGTYLAIADHNDIDEMLAALDVAHYTRSPDKLDLSAPDIFSGFQVPGERFDDFYMQLQLLSERLKIALPLSGHVYTGVYSIHPSFDIRKTGDKQKIMKLLDELSQLVLKYGGAFISEGGEGRLKGKFLYPYLDPNLVKMYEDVKKVFDPRGVFNPGVKESIEVKKLAEMIRSSNDQYF